MKQSFLIAALAIVIGVSSAKAESSLTTTTIEVVDPVVRGDNGTFQNTNEIRQFCQETFEDAQDFNFSEDWSPVFAACVRAECELMTSGGFLDGSYDRCVQAIFNPVLW